MGEYGALTAEDLAKRWKVKTTTLSNWRSRKQGPPYLKLPHGIRYLLEDVVAFERDHKKLPTE